MTINDILTIRDNYCWFVQFMTEDRRCQFRSVNCLYTLHMRDRNSCECMVKQPWYVCKLARGKSVQGYMWVYNCIGCHPSLNFFRVFTGTISVDKVHKTKWWLKNLRRWHGLQKNMTKFNLRIFVGEREHGMNFIICFKKCACFLVWLSDDLSSGTLQYSVLSCVSSVTKLALQRLVWIEMPFLVIEHKSSSHVYGNHLLLGRGSLAIALRDRCLSGVGMLDIPFRLEMLSDTFAIHAWSTASRMVSRLLWSKLRVWVAETYKSPCLFIPHPNLEI